MSIIVPPQARTACEMLKEKGFQAYLVGGAIRDSLLGLAPTDWDITTDAKPEEVEELFEKSLPTGKQFGTITIFIDKKPLEITTMRSDGPYSDGRRPDHITFTNRLELDLARRDFTINAIAYDPFQDQIIDPFLGTRHIRKRLLVAVGDPGERFEEDPLRMLRLIRFQSALGFRIKKKTRKTLPGLARLISKVSPERILVELNKMLLGRELRSALETFYQSGLMEEIIPELAVGYGLSPGERHPFDLLGHGIASAHFSYPDLTLRWAALLHDVGKAETLNRDHEKISALWAQKILLRLRATNELIQRVTKLIANHMFAVHPHSSEGEIRKFLGVVSPETAFDLLKLRQADMAGMNADPRQILAFGQAMEARFNEILTVDNALTLKDLKLDGRYLMHHLQLEPGPLVGEILHHLLEQVWAKPFLNQPELLLNLARNYLKSSPESLHQD